MDIDREAAKWAERRHGLIRADAAARIGFTRQQIDYRLQSGRWHRVRDRVYRIGGAPPSWEQQILAATWTSGRNALASHGSGLRLWRLGDADQLEVITTREHHVRLPGVTSHRSLALPDEDRTRRRGIPVTSVARTIVDVSGQHTPEKLAV